MTIDYERRYARSREYFEKISTFHNFRCCENADLAFAFCVFAEKINDVK
jgi:hypothetical protein